MPSRLHVLAEAAALADALTADSRDVLLTFPGVQLPEGAVERLVDAALTDTTVATVSAMVDGGRLAPSPLTGGSEDAAAVLRTTARIRPRIARPVAGCVLVRRSAIDAVGALVEADVRRPAAWLAEFAEHCAVRGLAHVLADDVLARGVPAATEPADEAGLDARFPHRRAAGELDDEDDAPAQRALRLASRELRPISVTVDGRALGPHRNGTWVHALELIAALGRTGALQLRVVTPPDLDPVARQVLEALDDVLLLPYEQAANEGPHPVSDIVHRPSQVFSPEDLLLLVPLGRRVVVTQQDLISFRIGHYHATPEQWLAYRRTTRAVLSAADRIVFFTNHARADAVAAGLVTEAESCVIPIGVDHRAAPVAGAARRPAALAGDEPFLLCLGADLEHKNLAFAERLADELRASGAWSGRLVFAGPGTDARAGGLGTVDDDERAWLLAHADAVVYPTLYEGFGLIPFEAAAGGAPCLFAAQSALAETMPVGAAVLVPWDAAASAARAEPLLRSGPERDAHVELLRGAAARYRWDATAAALVELYADVLAQPPREARRGAVERLAMEAGLADSERLRIEEWERFEAFKAEIGSDALALVGPGGLLATGDQRMLTALLSKPWLRRPALAAVRTAHRTARGLLGAGRR